jgi:hypothetical protein
VEVQSLHQVRPVSFDSIHAQVEKRGDFLVGSALGRQLQDVLFMFCQQVVRVLEASLLELPQIIFEQSLSDLWTEERFASHNGLNGLCQIRFGGVLEQISPRSGR